MYRPPRCTHFRGWPFLLVGLFGSCAYESGWAQEPKILPLAATEGAPAKIRGFELGVRVGYGFNLPNTPDFLRISRVIPLWADLGYRVHPNWYVGAFFQFGIAQDFDACSARYHPPFSLGTPHCSGNDLRFGANVHYHFQPDQKLDPWVAIGVGYELAHFSVVYSHVGSEVSVGDVSGFEPVNLQLGLDYRSRRAIGLGPFVAITLAQYSSQFAKSQGYDKLHGWLMAGVRVVFDVIVD